MEIARYFDRVGEALKSVRKEEVTSVLEVIYKAYEKQQNVFIIGNGGSASNATHFAQDLAKGVVPADSPQPRIRAISLTDNISFITAAANDHGYERIFEIQLKTYARPGDVLIAISGSGNSRNITRAIQYAKSFKLITVGVTGYDGGEVKRSVDTSLHVPLHEMCTVESIHSLIFHLVVLLLREKITGVPFDEACLVSR